MVPPHKSMFALCMFLQSYLGTMQGGEICGYTITCSGAGLLQDLYHQCSRESGIYLLFLMEHQPPSTHKIMDKMGKKVRQGKRNEDPMWSTVWWHTALAGEVQLRWWEVINEWMECGELSSPVWKLQVCETHHRVCLRAARSHNGQPSTLGIFIEKECAISHCHSPYNDKSASASFRLQNTPLLAQDFSYSWARNYWSWRPLHHFCSLLFCSQGLGNVNMCQALDAISSRAGCPNKPIIKLLMEPSQVF